ncbi:MAG TPA: SDR family oxidoreductase [Caulobacteraceae bacterium]|nr:SDR family oxidoreductase [Caulobacteraceae bacterium]
MSVKQLLDLTGRVAVITGGSRGLGLQIAGALGEMGAIVALTARKQDELDKAVAHLSSQNVEASGWACDVGKPEQIPDVVDAIVARYGRIDILVNNAGATWGAPAEDHPLDAWNKLLAINMTGAFVMSQQVARKAMIPAGYGRIIVTASVAGLLGNDARVFNTVAYNASKHGVIGLTRQLAAEWGAHGITANAICPGVFPSKMTTGLIEASGAALIAGTPTGRLGGEDDLKGLAVLLASDASRHITGQAIAVDGGAGMI